MKTYMVIERFKPGCMAAVYERFEKEGRMLPEGLYYIDSWLCADKEICFQLMETDDESLFTQWFRAWDDLVEFEVCEVGKDEN